MSAPAAKYSSLPAITMQRISGSYSQPSISAASSSMTSGLSALRASGRLRRATATAPWRSASKSVDSCGCSANDQLLDLGRALVEGRDARVAQVALDRVVVDVAGAAMHLDRRVGGAHGRLGRVQLRDRGLHRV